MMKVVRVLVVVVFFFMSLAVFAQKAPTAEASVDYSMVMYNPAKNYTGTRYLNGGGGAIVYNFGKYLGLKGEFQGYASTTATFTVPAGRVIPPGIYKTQANMFTYLFGPQINFRIRRGKIFAETLFGGAHSNGYANLYRAAGYGTGSAQNNGFAMAMGGGFDYHLTDSFDVRVAEVDYFLTRYSVVVLGTNNQSNFRYVGGIVYRFGGK